MDDGFAPVTSPSIAIVGSGPSGCYIAQFLRKRWRDAEIVVFDRLPLRYGLVRYGVAPDHLGTKAVTRQFDRLFEQDGVIFVGETEIGTQVSVDELRSAFDVVILATGLSADRPLAVPGWSLHGVYGAGRVTRLVNGHPDEFAAGVDFGSRVTIVGHGNVAVDLVRILLSKSSDLRAFGVAEGVVEAIGAGPIRHIDVVGRSGAHAAKFDAAMVRELAKLSNVRFVAEDMSAPPESADAHAGAHADGRAKHDAVATLVNESGQAERTVQFHFGWVPEQVMGASTVSGIIFSSAQGDGTILRLATDSVLTAIGFEEVESAPVRRRHHESAVSDLDAGYLAEGLYCVGWLRRGPRGTIPINRQDSKMVADVIAAAFESGNLSAGKLGLAALRPFSILLREVPA